MAAKLDAVIAVNRFGLGAKSGELLSAKSDPRAWLIRQAKGDRPLSEAIAKLPSSSDVFKKYVGAQEAQQAGVVGAEQGGQAIGAAEGIDNDPRTRNGAKRHKSCMIRWRNRGPCDGSDNAKYAGGGGVRHDVSVIGGIGLDGEVVRFASR